MGGRRGSGREESQVLAWRHFNCCQQHAFLFHIGNETYLSDPVGVVRRLQRAQGLEGGEREVYVCGGSAQCVRISSMYDLQPGCWSLVSYVQVGVYVGEGRGRGEGREEGRGEGGGGEGEREGGGRGGEGGERGEGGRGRERGEREGRGERGEGGGGGRGRGEGRGGKGERGEREGREELPPVCWSPGCRRHCTARRAQSASQNTSTLRETGEENIGKVITCTQHTK